LDIVLETLEDVKWSPSRFLLELLKLEKTGQEETVVALTRIDNHKQVVKAINGTTKQFIGEILELLWRGNKMYIDALLSTPLRMRDHQ